MVVTLVHPWKNNLFIYYVNPMVKRSSVAVVVNLSYILLFLLNQLIEILEFPASFNFPIG